MPKYSKQHARTVKKLCLLGATDAEIADFFDETEATIAKWKVEHPEFNFAIKMGKLKADSKVASSMYKRACGYEYMEEKAFSYMGDIEKIKIKRHMAADVNAGKFWLKNRQPDKWQENPTPQQGAINEPWEIVYTDEDDPN